MNKPRDFEVGQRVQAHPATDRWMRGDRFGTVEEVGTRFVWVRFDLSGDLVKLDASLLMDASW